MLNRDEFHFLSNKKKAQFKLNKKVGPYIVYMIETSKEEEGILK